MTDNKYSYKFIEKDGKLEIVFSGRMETVFISEEMDKILTKIADCDTDVDLNLEAVDYISSSFLRLCISALKSANGKKRKVLVTKLQPAVKKVFKIASLEAMIG